MKKLIPGVLIASAIFSHPQPAHCGQGALSKRKPAHESIQKGDKSCFREAQVAERFLYDQMDFFYYKATVCSCKTRGDSETCKEVASFSGGQQSDTKGPPGVTTYIAAAGLLSAQDDDARARLDDTIRSSSNCAKLAKRASDLRVIIETGVNSATHGVKKMEFKKLGSGFCINKGEIGIYPDDHPEFAAAKAFVNRAICVESNRSGGLSAIVDGPEGRLRVNNHDKILLKNAEGNGFGARVMISSNSVVSEFGLTSSIWHKAFSRYVPRCENQR